MNIIITGSLAYDRIMDFPGRFREHILPDKVHVLNVAFTLNKLAENFGGTAGNIAHNLKLLELEPVIVSSAGQDFERYREYLAKKDISTKYIAIDESEYTAVGNIITDLDDNQITAFFPGSHQLGAAVDLPKEFRNKDILLLIAPSSKQEIVKRCREGREFGLAYIFDPGQVIPMLSAEELLYGIEHSRLSIFNDYEWQLVSAKIGWTIDDVISQGVVLIITQGHEGSVIYDKKDKYQIGVARPSEVLDPTGAGDAYRAGIVAGVVKNCDWQTSGQLAATIASFAVEKYGTQAHQPTLAEIKERYQKNFNSQCPL